MFDKANVPLPSMDRQEGRKDRYPNVTQDTLTSRACILDAWCMTDYMDLEQLARELGTTTANLLAEAQVEMDRAYSAGGIDALTGLSTGTRQRGAVAVATVSPALAQLLRVRHA